MARFYADENFPGPVVNALRAMGHDVLTALEAGQANQRISDEQVIAFASVRGRIVLTLNRRHFVREHQRSGNHHGIVTCTADSNYLALAERIDDVIDQRTDVRRRLIRVIKRD